MHSDHITVHLDVGDRFWGYYRVYWDNPQPPPPPPPPQRCSASQQCCGTVNPDGSCDDCWPRGRPCP
jgi:hypothetical protein